MRRSRPALNGVTLVAFTAGWTKELERQLLKAGAKACLAKPVQAEQLLALFEVPLRLAAAKP